ncbi:NAD-dependent epimerase/dehydratase family protein [Anaeromyxobacter paludicola]|uniref:dTDP-glucose 4,6-dehydratase n=1 Tax=Anaeromyxobacter paludicola TaxID=2918171 RepID=A0ABM7X5S6_9BACT|nr:NAD-dependent epimerase/dehydratase family protein [Anaeromyxobacter paludicola]BDG07168.1 dTDP-glucose 4,6-dehydratase [Anaeromyxobacter paludicola]
MTPRAIDLVRQDCRDALQGREGLLSELKGSRLLVTGGTGFMGTWLAELVACLNDEHGYGVGLTLLSRSTDRFSMELPHLAGRPDVALLKADVRHVVEIPQDTRFVVHAAASPDNRAHATEPVETMELIANGTSAVLRAVGRCSSFSRLLNLSSALVSGRQGPEHPALSEAAAEAPPVGEVGSAYGEAKRYAETLCGAARSQYKVPVVTARPFAFVGPFMQLDRPWAVTDFLRDAMTGQAIRVLGDGQTVRSYLYGSEAAFWLLRTLVAGVPGRAYNVGSPEAVTLESLAQLIAAQFSPRPEVRLNAGGAAVQKTRLVPDLGRARRELGLEARIDLASAIQRTVAWHRVR